MRALSIHADYRCRHSGACCTSGWAIEVEPGAERRIREALAEGRLRTPSPVSEPAESLLVAASGLPDGARCHVGRDSRGHCLFFDARGGRLCAVHRDLGAAALPAACRHFPRVARIGPTGAALSLSHYCPSAADRLFDDGVPLAVVTESRAFPSDAAYEGLDARGHVPPLLRPGVLLGWEALERWEDHLVSLFACENMPPETAVARLESLARDAAAWSVHAGPFDPFFSVLLERAPAESTRDTSPTPEGSDSTRHLWETVVAATAPGLPRPGFPAAFEDLWGRFVDPSWRRHRRVVNRYLAARGFASWYGLLADGLRAATRAVAAALAVLEVECVRRVEASEAPLDSEDLREAIRATDLRLIHHARPEVLARLLAAAFPRAGGAAPSAP